tara:strand:- start:30 stop:674 length:645 start_codon:yes stop_codon:yes gene_type:complete
MIDQKLTKKVCLRWKGKQKRIGITGGIASGKTIIGNYLFQTKGWPILDADLYAHEALNTESSISKKVLLRFGDAVLQTSKKDKQTIDRKALARIVFQDDFEKTWLESIIHPFVNKRLHEELKKLKSSPIIILIIPLLFEKDYTNLCSEICYVDCDRDKQLKRLQARDKLSIEEANQRINAQWDNRIKKKLADHIIDNSNDNDSWKIQLKKIYNF